MRSILGAIVTVSLLGAATVAASAQAAPKQPPLPTLELLKRMLEVNSRNKLLFGPAQTCPTGTTCTFDVELTETADPNDPQKKPVGCVIATPDITISPRPAGSDRITTITLKLVVKTPVHGSASYAFAPNGMVVVKEHSTGVLHNATTNSARTEVTFKHRYRPGDHGREAFYFPLAIQTIDETPVFMCGARDPKIVNG